MQKEAAKKLVEESKNEIERLRCSNENVAHELRAPLGSIIVIINILLGFRNSGITERRNSEQDERARTFLLQIKF